MLTVGFHQPHLCLRGTTVAMYDYANFNTKKHVCEALIPLMLPDNYQPLLSQKSLYDL